MTPVKVPTVLCADTTPGQETAATNATATKDGFDMPNLPRSLGDQPATASVDANDCAPYWNWACTERRMRCPQNSRDPAAAPFSDYLKRHSKARSEEHTSELQSLRHLVCRLLLEKKNKKLQ